MRVVLLSLPAQSIPPPGVCAFLTGPYRERGMPERKAMGGHLDHAFDLPQAERDESGDPISGFLAQPAGLTMTGWQTQGHTALEDDDAKFIHYTEIEVTVPDWRQW